ncbi:MAG: hypothetical protein Ct9H90mP8_3870 [Pseudomonadota bacterium]|nr:MAG: hypothetical protein Ct9H90mP8_3870 [Pseudomonadota bacterium]
MKMLKARLYDLEQQELKRKKNCSTVRNRISHGAARFAVMFCILIKWLKITGNPNGKQEMRTRFLEGISMD